VVSNLSRLCVDVLSAVIRRIAVKGGCFFFDSSTDARPDPSEPGCYAYDPSDPTPAWPRVSGVRPTGNMAQLERRSDVLLFTAEPLDANLE
jgi:predicted acyl esterase